MGRLPMHNNSINNNELVIKRGPWTPEEDQILISHIEKHGRGNWQLLPKRAGLNRCGRSCRLRWTNYLRPDIKRGNFSVEEQQTIIHLHSILGNKWSRIASKLPGRTDNEIKNFWNTHIRKKLMLSGIDPQTHQPIPKFAMHHDSNFSNLIMNNIAKIQLLCNILQTLNTPVPNLYMESPPYHQHFEHYIQVPSPIPNMVNDNTFVFGNFEPIWNSISTSCARSIPEFSGINYESTISGRTLGYSPPVFVPTTPEGQFLRTFDNLGIDGDDAISFWKDIFIQSSSSL